MVVYYSARRSILDGRDGLAVERMTSGGALYTTVNSGTLAALETAV